MGEGGVAVAVGGLGRDDVPVEVEVRVGGLRAQEVEEAAEASPVIRCRRSVTTRAPALMNGLRGMPCSYSSWTSELKGLPEGSRPTCSQRLSPSRARSRASVKTLVTDWVEKGCCHSPTPYTVPSSSATAIPKRFGSTAARAGM